MAKFVKKFRFRSEGKKPLGVYLAGSCWGNMFFVYSIRLLTFFSRFCKVFRFKTCFLRKSVQKKLSLNLDFFFVILFFTVIINKMFYGGSEHVSDHCF